MMDQDKAEPLIFRQVAFPLSAFDYLKEYQRSHEKTYGVRLNNNQTLALILAEHKQMNEDSGEQRDAGSKAGT